MPSNSAAPPGPYILPFVCLKAATISVLLPAFEFLAPEKKGLRRK